jgi:hypothetical protein
LVEGKVDEQYLEMYCNGIFLLGHVSSKLDKEVLFTEIHPSLSAFGSLKIDFIFPNALVPNKLGISNDLRCLAYKLFEFQII